jgi:hypothetical protein
MLNRLAVVALVVCGAIFGVGGSAFAIEAGVERATGTTWSSATGTRTTIESQNLTSTQIDGSSDATMLLQISGSGTPGAATFNFTGHAGSPITDPTGQLTVTNVTRSTQTTINENFQGGSQFNVERITSFGPNYR